MLGQFKMSKFKNFVELLFQKGFEPSFFQQTEDLDIDSAIEKHAENIFELYAEPYVINGKQEKRVFHGIAHVSRAAFYIPVLFSMYKRYEPSLELQVQDLKLL